MTSRNNRFSMGGVGNYRSLLTAAAIFCCASAASAASTNEFTFIDIMETVRQSEVESPITVAYTGAHSSSASTSAVMQLFDGDLTVDNNAASDDTNGRVLFVLANGPSVTVSFNPAVFENRPIALRQYGFRMGYKSTATGWQISNRLPAAWTVEVSDKENPATDDDWTVVDRRSGLTSDSYTFVNNSYYLADFLIKAPIAFRHIRFIFTGALNSTTNVQLGEVCISGLIGPDEDGRRDVCPYGAELVSVNADGSATAKVSILPAGAEVDPYDLFVIYRTGDRVTTNLLEHVTQITGLYEATIPGLRLDADYTLQFGTVATNGTVELGEVVGFSTAFDVMPSGMLPVGYEMVEYIESTDTGHQYIDCGFAPNSVRLGFAIDFIGYSSFQKGTSHDTDDRDTGYGVYLSSVVQGKDAQLLISTSSGMKGNFSTGLFWYNQAYYNAKLTRNGRMQITLDESTGSSNYRAICGATTNIQNVTQATISSGPNVFVFAAGNGQGNNPDQFGVMRLYSLKFYNDSASPRELIHDFVPVRKISDGTYGLYDLVAGVWCPNGSATPFLAGAVIPGAGRLDLSSVRSTGRALTATLTRAETSSADVYAAWGSTYGGIDTASWQHTQLCGSFAENEQSAEFTTPNMSSDTVYVRFYTADGKWSETVYLPDYKSTGGLVIFVR